MVLKLDYYGLKRREAKVPLAATEAELGQTAAFVDGLHRCWGLERMRHRGKPPRQDACALKGIHAPLSVPQLWNTRQ